MVVGRLGSELVAVRVVPLAVTVHVFGVYGAGGRRTTSGCTINWRGQAISSLENLCG